jgi:hypothetical protein
MSPKQSLSRDIIEGAAVGLAISAAAAVVVGMHAKYQIREYVGGLKGSSVIGLAVALILGPLGGIIGRRIGSAALAAAALVGAAWLVIGFLLYAWFLGGS